MKKRIIVIMPDRFEQSVGGMGANAGPMFEVLSRAYEFYVAGYPLTPGTKVPDFIKEYREVYGPFTEVKFSALNTMISQIKYLSAAISFPKPDLIYAYDWSVYLAAVEAAEYFKVPLVARMCLSAISLSHHGYTFGLNLNDPVEKALHNSFCEMEIRGLKRADRIVQVSEEYAKTYDTIAPFRPKTRVVHNGIDLSKWQGSLARSFRFPGKNKHKIVYIGRLVEMKGVLQLCQAKIPDGIDLIFIGEMDRADAICKRAIEEKMKRESNVYCLGALYGEDKIAAMRAADGVIVPSLHETFGNVGMEALAARSVVLTSRVGGLGDYLDTTNSIFCGTSAVSIEKSFTTFLNMSEVDRDQLRVAGLKRAKEMTVEKAADALETVFAEAVVAYPPPGINRVGR